MDDTTKIRPMGVIPQNIPEVLTRGSRFVGIKMPMLESGKLDKIPKNPKTGRNASPTDPTTWGTLDEAMAKYSRVLVDGIGRALMAYEGFIAIDLDGVVERPRIIKPEAQAIIDSFASYWEISPSGTGVHIWIRGKFPPGDWSHKRGPFEAYNDKRIMSMTGQVIGEPLPIVEAPEALLSFLETYLKREPPTYQAPAPSFSSGPLPSDQEIIDRMFTAPTNGAAIRALWDGESPSGDASADDLALLNHVGFYTNYDPALMERVASSAPRFQRDKWRLREDYRRRTIERAIEGRSGDGYNWPVAATIRFTGKGKQERDEPADAGPADEAENATPPEPEEPQVAVDADQQHDDADAGISEEAVRFSDNLAGDHRGLWERRNETWTLILNARIRITEDVTVNHADGTHSGRLVLTGTLGDGRRLPEISVPADEFASMKWLYTNGYLWRQANMAPGNMIPGKIRWCITHESQLAGVKQSVVECMTGWGLVDGERIFRFAENSIGASGVRTDIEVELPSGFEGYVGIEPSTGDQLAEDFATWMTLLDVTSDDVTSVLASAPARAILGEIRPQDAAIYSSGYTGSYKTALHMLVLGHFGVFDHPPLNWTGTANAIELALSRTKDVVCIVDDFVTPGTRNDGDRKQSDLDRILRNIGNRGGRARANRMMELQETPYAKGLVDITGEETSNSQSAVARTVTVRHDRNRTDTTKLTNLQRAVADGVCRRVTAAFIQYQAGHWREVESAFNEAFVIYRDRYRAHNLGHPRTAETLAGFAASSEVWFNTFVLLGAVDRHVRDAQVARIERGLLIAGTAQAEAVHETDPIQTFVELLRASVSSWHAHLADAESDSEPRQSTRFGWQAEMLRSRESLEQVVRPKGDRIGWINYDRNALYLTPSAALAVVQGMGDRTGRRVHLSEKMLGRRLVERNVLQSTDNAGRSTARISVAGGRQRVWHFRLSDVFPEERREPGQIDVFPGANREEVA